MKSKGWLWYGSEFIRGVGQAFVLFAVVLFAIERLHSVTRWSGVLFVVTLATLLSLWVLPRLRVRALAAWLVASLVLSALGLTLMLVAGPEWMELGAIGLGYLAYSLGHTLVSTYEFPFAFQLFSQKTAVARVYAFNTAGNVVGFGIIVGIGALSHHLSWVILGAAVALGATAVLRVPLALDPQAPQLTATPGTSLPRQTLGLVYASSALLGVGFSVIPTYQAYLLTHVYAVSTSAAAAICVIYYVGLVVGSAVLEHQAHPPRLLPRLVVLVLASGALVIAHTPVLQAVYLFVLGFGMSQLGAEVERRLLLRFTAVQQIPFSQHRGTARLLASVGSIWLAGYAAHQGIAVLYGGMAVAFLAGVPVIRRIIRDGAPPRPQGPSPSHTGAARRSPPATLAPKLHRIP